MDGSLAYRCLMTSQDRLQLYHCLAIARRAARAGGDVLVDMLMTAGVREKSTKDLVTDADEQAQDLIQSTLLSHFPKHAFLGEEGPAEAEFDWRSADACWIVDPLDGTANYVHKLGYFAVSIALTLRGEPVVGVVDNPLAGETFYAIRGEGAFLNDRPISVSRCEHIGDAMIAASFPPDVKAQSPEVEHFGAVLQASRSIRRLGSAALNLCYVGCGRLDAYWAQRLRAWDIAAGVLIATEAGAELSDVQGGPFDLADGSLAASANQPLHRQLVSLLRKA